MSENYKEAARRHFEDAEYLHLDSRHPNAAQLYGLSAECSIKALLVALGHSIKIKKHIDELAISIVSIETYVNSRVGNRYSAAISSVQCFSDWKISHRYESASAIPLNSIDKWQQSANDVQVMIQQAFIDGFIK